MRASNEEKDEIMSRPTCTIEEFAKVIGCGRTQAYQMIKAGRVRSIKVGNRFWIPTSAIQELLDHGMSVA